MAFEALTTVEILAGKFAKARLFQKIKNSLDFLNGEIASQSKNDYTPNGSFELDSDGDGIPDRWTRNLYPGGNGYRDTNNAIQGTACIACVHPGGAGNGGAYFDSDYIPCSPLETTFLGIAIWATNATMRVQVQLLYFNKDQVTIGADATVYNSTANPTSPAMFLIGQTPPAGARFMRIRLIGGKSDVNQAGTAFFDALSLAPIYAGIPRAAIQDFTIAEASSSANNTWVAVGSAGTIIPHVQGLPMTVTFNAEHKGGGTFSVGGDPVESVTYYARMRFKIGSSYSNEQLSYSNSYQTNSYSISLPAGTTGPLSITMELFRETGAYVAFGRAITPGTKIAANI